MSFAIWLCTTLVLCRWLSSSVQPWCYVDGYLVLYIPGDTSLAIWLCTTLVLCRWLSGSVHPWWYAVGYLTLYNAWAISRISGYCTTSVLYPFQISLCMRLNGVLKRCNRVSKLHKLLFLTMSLFVFFFSMFSSLSVTHVCSVRSTLYSSSLKDVGKHWIVWQKEKKYKQKSLHGSLSDITLLDQEWRWSKTWQQCGVKKIALFMESDNL